MHILTSITQSLISYFAAGNMSVGFGPASRCWNVGLAVSVRFLTFGVVTPYWQTQFIHTGREILKSVPLLPGRTLLRILIVPR
jgi:hypothetical protein